MMRTTRHTLIVNLSIIGLALMAGQRAHTSALLGTFTLTGSMTIPRAGHSAVVLPDGKVLTAGNGFGDRTADLYDPSAGSFSPTGSLNVGRCRGCVAVGLPSGKVLVVGGWTGAGPVLSSAELYDPSTGTFSFTSGNLLTGRLGALTVLLQDGRVLVLMGHNGSAPIGSVEIYDPATDQFSPTGSLAHARLGTATLLNDGTVLVAGGGVAAAERYDPVTGIFTPTGAMAIARYWPQAVRLGDGRVLIAGGYTGSGQRVTAAEIYDPTTQTFSMTGSMMTPRLNFIAVLLNNQRVLLMGGYNAAGQTLASTEIYDPATQTFTAGPDMNSPRAEPSVTTLLDGRLFVSGGFLGNGFLATSEIYTTPAEEPQIEWSPTPTTYGVPLGPAQLNATSDVAGTFVYDPPAGTILSAGTHTITVAFTPDDDSRYVPTSASATVTVARAVPTLTVQNVTATYNSQPHPASASAVGVGGEPLAPLSLTYNGGAAAPVNAGTYTVFASFAGNANYEPASGSGTVVIARASTSLTWAPTSPLILGSALSAAQLNATASVPGTFEYAPATGAVLPIGTHTLNVTFTPADVTNYTPASATASIQVAYAICLLYNPDRVSKIGSTIPIKLTLCDASGNNVSAPDRVVTATGLARVGSVTTTDVEDSGNANPDLNFRFDPASGGYIFNMSTKGLIEGVWELRFVAAGDPTTHVTLFRVH